MRLLLRFPGDPANGDSPFESALDEVAASGTLDVAAPYLSVPILHTLIARAPAFRLVTDAEEWLRAFARPARQEILDFIAAHPDAVRHYRDLHAKVALSPTRAMFGSANFTQRGLFERQEVGALVDDASQVGALRAWFEGLWQHATPIDLDQLAAFAESLPLVAQTEHAPLARVLPPPASTPPHASAPNEREDVEWALDTEERLVHYLADAPSRSWVEQFLEATRVLVEGLGVSNGDPHVVVSMRKGRFHIAVTINGRWVLQTWRDPGVHRGTVGVGILQSAARVEAEGHVGADVADSYQYDHRAGDTESPPWMLAFADFAWLNDTRYLTEWLVAAQGELYKARGSSNAASHSRILFRTAVDRAYRQHLFARVHWANA